MEEDIVLTRARSLRPLSIAGVVVALTTVPRFAAAESSTIERCLEGSDQGQVSRDGGHLLDARRLFLMCSDEACPAPVKSQCAKWAAEVEADLPSVVFGARDASGADLYDVDVLMDGKLLTSKLDGRAFPLDPGRHVFSFATGARRAEQAVLLRLDEHVAASTFAAHEAEHRVLSAIIVIWELHGWLVTVAEE